MPAYSRPARPFRVGQRVLAPFGYPRSVIMPGVVTQDDGGHTVYVQNHPCGPHWGCTRESVSAHGDANGWTDREYRVEGEAARTRELAREVEAERQSRYPGAAFSAAVAS